MLIIDIGDVNNPRNTTIQRLCLSPFDSANIIHQKALVKSFVINFFTYFLQTNQII